MFYWDAFWELGTTRHEIGPIPFTAVNDFCYRYHIYNQEFDSFSFFIRGMDSEYLTIKSNEMEAKRNIDSAKSKSKRKR